MSGEQLDLGQGLGRAPYTGRHLGGGAWRSGSAAPEGVRGGRMGTHGHPGISVTRPCGGSSSGGGSGLERPGESPGVGAGTRKQWKVLEKEQDRWVQDCREDPGRSLWTALEKRGPGTLRAGRLAGAGATLLRVTSRVPCSLPHPLGPWCHQEPGTRPARGDLPRPGLAPPAPAPVCLQPPGSDAPCPGCQVRAAHAAQVLAPWLLRDCLISLSLSSLWVSVFIIFILK